MQSRPVRRGRSRSGGVPVVLDDRPAAPGTLFADVALPESREEVLPGAVLVPGWLDDPAQRDLVAAFREWARPPAGLRHPRMPTGHVMSVQSVCLGWHWQPYVYSRTADDTDGAPVKLLPDDVAHLDPTDGAGSLGRPLPAVPNLGVIRLLGVVQPRFRRDRHREPLGAHAYGRREPRTLP